MNYMAAFSCCGVFLCGVILCGVILSGTVTVQSTSQSSDETVERTRVLEGEFMENDDCIFIVTKHGVLSANHTLKPSEKCIWNIIGNDSVEGSSGLMFEKVHLDDSDNMTVHSAGGNETVIFGPYHGSLGPIVIAVDEKNFTVKLSTSANKKTRSFQVMYSENCMFSIPPSIEIIESPIYGKKDKVISCTYDYNKIHDDVSYSFVFKNFTLDSMSNLDVSKADGPNGIYGETPPDIFGSLVRFNMTLNLNSSGNTFTILRRDLYRSCSGFIQLPTALVPLLQSPSALESYNDTTNFECRWLINTTSGNGILELLVDKLHFSNVFDMLIVNDGPSELSRPIVQATFINQNETKAEVIRSSGPYMWVSFRSEAFASNFSGNYSQGQGGFQNGSGSISLQSGSDAVYLLEVSQDEKVLLKFSLSSFASPAIINVYDGFYRTSNLIAHLSGNIWYPVVSSTSKMMVIASNFSGTEFSAAFSGIKSDCMHMSASYNDVYLLSGNCNSSCAWIVPPKNYVSEGVLLLGFQFLSLDVSDVVEVFRLGNSQTSVAKILPSTKHVPPLAFNPNEGFLVNVSRGECSAGGDTVLVARSTYLPGCSENFSLVPSSELQLSSPNYPNLYPLFASCQWNLAASGNTSQFYLSFNSMKLASYHCIQITHTIGGSGTETEVFYGDVLPDDMLFENVTIQFDSFNCNKSGVAASLASDEGFVLNVTSSDCGSIMTTKTGNFTTPKGKISCFWVIQVPYSEKDGSVNSIMFTVDEKGEKGNNSEFRVYDGPSVRDFLMANLTGNVWSRNNTVIFVYKRFNSSADSALYTVNYKTINCNKTMQCKNGICLHPDWLCDGFNNCGDFTDERNCETVPVPDSIKETNGVSPLAFGLVTVLFFGLGALAAFLIPKAINRYRNGRYHQFQDYAGVD